MSFHEVRLPSRLAFGSTGGVERRTEIVTLESRYERRSTPWAQGRRRYLMVANLRSLDAMAALTEFFEARRGRLYGFRFRGFADFKSCAPGAVVSAEDQVLGTGDGVRTRFDLIKRYGEGDDALERRVREPVAGTGAGRGDGCGAGCRRVRVRCGDGRGDAGGCAAGGAVVTAGFEFDVPVRFDADRIEVTLESFEAGRMTASGGCR